MSPYLNRPLRTLYQAQHDIAQAESRATFERFVQLVADYDRRQRPPSWADFVLKVAGSGA